MTEASAHPTGGAESIVDAFDCDARALRSRERLEAIFARVIDDLSLQRVGSPQWHVFPGTLGITATVILAESHLTCHTFPESGFAAFNLYCCTERPAWPWAAVLADALGAGSVSVRTVTRPSTRGLAHAGS